MAVEGRRRRPTCSDTRRRATSEERSGADAGRCAVHVTPEDGSKDALKLRTGRSRPVRGLPSGASQRIAAELGVAK